MARPKKSTEEVDEIDELINPIVKRYSFVLAQENEKTGKVFDENGRQRGEPKYRPYENLLLISSILWEGKKRRIRYYDGCTTLFVDEQPKDKETIDAFIQSTQPRVFAHGFIDVYEFEEMLLKYMQMCSWNGESKYRIPTSAILFMPVDSEKQAEREGDDLDVLEEALEFAKTADTKHMRIHAKFLGIPEVHYRTSNPLTVKEIRTEYRKKAKENPKRFIETFNDKSILTTEWVKEALKSGEINTTIIPNKAVWGKKGAIICDLSGLKTEEGIVNKLVEFSSLPEGQEFKKQLEALYN